MPEPDLIELFIRPIQKAGIRHFISGSVAAMLYGEPRLTNDIDLVVFLQSSEISRLSTVFPAPDYYLPPEEIIWQEVTRPQRGHFNLIHGESGLKADLYTAGEDDLHKWALERVQQYSLENTIVSLAPPEYIIIRKLQYFSEGGSEKHLRDIRAMLLVSGDKLDQTAFEYWLDRLSLQEDWNKIKNKVGNPLRPGNFQPHKPPA